MYVARDSFFLFFYLLPERVKSHRHLQTLRVWGAYCVLKTSTECLAKYVTVKKGLNGKGWLGEGRASKKVEKQRFQTWKNSKL